MMFRGFDEFIVDDDLELCFELPEQVRPIEHRKLIKVDLDCMKLFDDGGRTKSLLLRALSLHLSAATQAVYFYVVLHALNGRRKESTVLRWLSEFSRFLQLISSALNKQRISSITLEMLEHWSSAKSASQKKLLRSFLKYWSQLPGAAGLSEDLRMYLKTSRAPKPRGMMQIQYEEPSERPFSIEQIRAMLSNVERLHIDRPTFSPQDYLLWRLTISEALRPSQMDLLQIRDVHITEGPSAEMISVYLEIPIVKQARTAGRDILVTHRLPNAVAVAMVGHLKFLAKISPEPLASDQPLFCVHSRGRHARWARKTVAIQTASRIEKTRKLIVEGMSANENLELFTRRFKHTKLTHLAMLGASLEVLACAGFQTSTISLRRYVSLTDELATAYEELLLEHHETVLAAMSVRIVARTEATNKEPGSVILTPDLSEDLGSCMTKPCGALIPMACYANCPRFEAFVEAPHSLVEDKLTSRIERALMMRLSKEVVDRDRYILKGVRAVIEAIAEYETRALA